MSADRTIRISNTQSKEELDAWVHEQPKSIRLISAQCNERTHAHSSQTGIGFERFTCNIDLNIEIVSKEIGTKKTSADRPRFSSFGRSSFSGWKRDGTCPFHPAHVRP